MGEDVSNLFLSHVQYNFGHISKGEREEDVPFPFRKLFRHLFCNSVFMSVFSTLGKIIKNRFLKKPRFFKLVKLGM